MRLMSCVPILFASSFLVSCAGDDDDKPETCGTDQVEVAYLGTSNERTECHPIPSACGAIAQCAELECIRELYGLCEDPAIGVGCSDTFAPAIVSCNG